MFAYLAQEGRSGRPSYDMWTCDFLQVTDLLFRSLFAFFITELKSRKVIHVGVTRFPTDAWAAQQLREATPYGQTPKYLIRDHDSKFGPCFARVAATSSIEILKTPYHAPRANAIYERFLGSVRRECLDHDWSSMKNSCIGSYVPMSSILMGHDHIKASVSRFPKEKLPAFHQHSLMNESSQFRS